ncbi:reverse transcriptase domain-containing protein [Tanacetum coccineum]
MEKNVKNIPNVSLMFDNFNPSLCELPFQKEVPGLGILLSFSSKNEEKVFNPGILTSQGVHHSLLPELSHRDPKVFKDINMVENLMMIFPCSLEEDILEEFPDCEASCALGFCSSCTRPSHPQLH